VYVCVCVRESVCCDLMQLTIYYSVQRMLQCIAVSCSVLQCVAMCCSVMHCVAIWCSVLQCSVQALLDKQQLDNDVCVCVAVCCVLL